MSKKGGVATRPYKCLLVHTIGDSADECINALETVVQLLKAKSQDFPNNAEVTWNHGGGGGP